jgi:hypothetical protein
MNITHYFRLRELLEKELSVKTGWGKNEAIVAFDKACAKFADELASAAANRRSDSDASGA